MKEPGKIEDILKQPDHLKRKEIETNIRVSGDWIKAIESGTYSGAQVLNITTLLDYLKMENRKATDELATLIPAPVWTKPEPAAPVITEPGAESGPRCAHGKVQGFGCKECMDAPAGVPAENAI